MTDTLPTVSLLVVADGPWADTYRCLNALIAGAEGVPHEVIAIDDGTTDDTGLALPRLDGVTALRSDTPRGFAAAVNAGAEVARGRYLAIVHADAEPQPGWLAPLVALLDGDPGVAAAASRLVTPDGAIESEGIAFAYAAPYPLTPIPNGAGRPALPSDEVLEVPAAPATALLVRAEAFRAVQGLDAARGGVAGALDLCLRLGAAGGKVLLARGSSAIHHGRCSPDISDADAAWLIRRWLGKVPLFDPEGVRERAPVAHRAGRPALSVVVPVHNALGTVAPSLEALARNLAPDDELIIADAGSDDGTGEFARLFAGEHAQAARVLGAGGGLEGALRAGLGAASRGTAVLFHPIAAPPDGFLDALSALVERTGAPSTVATPTPAGACVLGPTALLRAVGDAAPGAFLRPDPALLSGAVAAQGGRLGLVEQGG
jgi:GT2 family glycosyltransferase